MGLRTFLGLKTPRGRKSDIGKRVYATLVEGLIQPAFPVDVVYTWVDGADPAFRETLGGYLRSGAGTAGAPATADTRWASHDELRYSLRSIDAYAPWVNHVYVVTNGQVPDWLAPGPRISVVRHDQILEPEYLPTFNSHVIESALHRIPGLSEHYVYFNDDVMLLRPHGPTDFFTENGLVYGFLSADHLPDGPPSEADIPSIWGAKNAVRLIQLEWGVRLDRRFKHTFYPQRLSVAADNERRFSVEYDRFRRNRFRAIDDVVVCTLLNGCAAYLTGRGLLRLNRTWYVSVRERSSIGNYARILAEKDTQSVRDSVCLNDADDVVDPLPDYAARLREFLEAYSPSPSPFERS